MKTITNNTGYFRQYVFWLLTFITALLISSIIALISDHYTLQNHIDYSYRTNTYQNQQIEKAFDKLQKSEEILTGATKDIENLKSNRCDDLKRTERLEHKVFRGGGNDSFSILDDGKIYDEHSYNSK